MKKIRYSMCIFFLSTIALQGFSQIKQNKADQHAKNIILLIGDGMGTSQIFAGLTANGGWLYLEKCPYVGFSKTQASNGYTTDSGAGATSIATGQQTYIEAIGVDSSGSPRETILETAEKKGLAMGLVATSSITHATPASFIAHQINRSMEEEIAADFLNTDIDVFIGGGRKYFANRKDGQDLLASLRAKGYQVPDSTEDLSRFRSGKLAALIANEHPCKVMEGRGDYIVKATQTAIHMLKQNKKGFFLMVEGSQIDWGAHANDTRYVTSELIDFDKAIGEALKFAEENKETLVVITADHETGGMSLINGNFKTGRVEAKFNTGGHTGVMVPVFAFGPGAENFAGIYSNTAIYEKMRQVLRLPLPK